MSARDCLDYGQMTPVATARAILARHAAPAVTTEPVPLAQARGRILARDLVSPRDVPPFDNVAVDGYAFAAASLEGGVRELRLVAGVAAAGHPHPAPVPPGHAVRALTGAPLPAGCDTVVMQEEVAVQGGRLRLPARIRAGAHVRRRGEDVALGAAVIAAGTRLGPQHLGVAAELGLTRLEVHAPLPVALFSSGDELVEPGAGEPGGGRIFDANRPILRALLETLPVKLSDLGILPDRRETVWQAVMEAARHHPLVITTGGASTGDEDHLSRLLEARGQVLFWRVAMKPGRPLGFGRLGEAFLFVLPGNPVAATLAFLLFARPFLLALAGAPFALPPALPLPAAFTLDKRPDRTEFARARLVRDDAGRLRVDRIPREGSGILTSLTEADGILELPPETTRVRPGDPVLYRSLVELGCG